MNAETNKVDRPINIFIPLRPITKCNEKARGRNGKVFLSLRFKEFERNCRLYALKQYRGKPLTGYLNVSMLFCFTDRKMPDLFNLPKSVCDAMNGLLWEDDRQIVKGDVEKILYHEDKIVISVTPCNLERILYAAWDPQQKSKA